MSLFLLPTVCVLLTCACSLQAAVKVNGIVGDGMVIQRNMPVAVFGSADAGERVTVKFGGQSISAKADDDARWSLKLAEMPANAVGSEMVISGDRSNEPVTIHDILVGDVWLCSGQSNMAFPMANLRNSPLYGNDLKSADYPMIRQGFVAHRPASTEQRDVNVKWSVCTPQTVGEFTAIGFYFARNLNDRLHVPVGLVNASWGSTSIDEWISLSSQSAQPTLKEIANKKLAELAGAPNLLKAFPNAMAAWEAKYEREDTHNTGEANGWAKTDFDDGAWKRYANNTAWAKLGHPNGGVFWLRKSVNLPSDATGKSFGIGLGWVSNQYATVYFNGEKIGDTGHEPPAFYSRWINHNVPGNLVRAGKNVLAIRLVANGSDSGGINRTGNTIGFGSVGQPDVDDNYLFNVEEDFGPLPTGAMAERPQLPIAGETVPTALFDGMIAPLSPFTLKGVLWYQGEADSIRGYDYRTLLPMLISDWRARWTAPTMPFIIVQLPNWRAAGTEGTNWAALREAQARTTETVPNSYLVCTIGLGESDDVHPTNKREAGARAALVAIEKVHGIDVKSSGPVFEKMTSIGDVLRLTFHFANGLKTSDGLPARYFAVAGDDRKFQPADATIEGDEIVLHCTSIAHPIAVRYAWINDPAKVNVVNGEGLPLQPFRTDAWPEETERNKKLNAQ